MRRILLVASVALAFAPRALAEGKRPPEPRPPVVPAPSADTCARASASARYEGYGYTHLVTLSNGCTRSVECALWTDVDPEPRASVQAAPGETVSIVTRRGSPARELAAFKSCKFR